MSCSLHPSFPSETSVTRYLRIVVTNDEDWNLV